MLPSGLTGLCLLSAQYGACMGMQGHGIPLACCDPSQNAYTRMRATTHCELASGMVEVLARPSMHGDTCSQLRTVHSVPCFRAV